MTKKDLDRWESSFRAFHARFGKLFARLETREQSRKYMQGLLSGVERKNGWQLAEAVGDFTADRMERLLYLVDWDADAARDILQEYVIESFPEGIGVVDETGFLKKGKGSVGVQRQYCGTAGKVENCQVAVFLTYATQRGHVFLDRGLYLPEQWAHDRDRRRKAKVPDSVTFQTKPELAQAMLDQAWDKGVAMQWVTGDEVYGNCPRLREFIESRGRYYVLAVSCTTAVWRLGGGDPVAVNSIPLRKWKRVSVKDGEKGPIFYDWARVRVIEKRQKAGSEVWLLARRSVSKPKEIAYYLSCAPKQTPLERLAQVASTRYTVEQCFEEAKGEAGLDHYEVRHWQSWHRHITLSMMAHAWLASIRAEEEEKGGTLNWVA